MFTPPDGNKANFDLETFTAPDGDKASFQLEGETIEYIPPVGDKVDFYLKEFTPPAGNEADFQLQESGKNIVWASAHISLNLGAEARAKVVLPFVMIYKVERFEELKTVSGTWECPHGIIENEVLVECWGGGGAGKSYTGKVGGGGGGAYAAATLDVVPGNVYDYTVANKAAPGGLPEDGEDTYWSDGSTIKVKAAGGKGGDVSVAGQGGKATDSIGDIRYSGGNGSYGGGGGAGSSGPGKNASGDTGGAATEEYGGKGGNVSYFGATVGYSGEEYGGAGGGGNGAYGHVSAGGSGAPGLIRITYDKLVAVPLSAHVSLNLGARAQAETRASKTPIEIKAHASLILGVKAKARVKVLIEAKAHNSLAFSLRATSEIFTPLAKQPIRPSTWHPGGETRAPTIVKLSLTEPLLPEFGIGLSAKMLHGSGIKDHVFWQAGDYICYYDKANGRIKMSNGMVATETYATWDVGDIVGIYAGRCDGKLFIQGKIAGVTTDLVKTTGDALSGVEEITIGSSSSGGGGGSGGSGSGHVNGVITDFTYHDDPALVNPAGYFAKITGGGA